MNKNIFFIFLSFFLFSVSNLHAKTPPSFDCNKASNEVEKLICSDDELAKLDVEMNDWYRKVIRWETLLVGASSDSIVYEQNEWLKRRNNFECTSKTMSKKDCLISLYKEAIQIRKNHLLSNELKRACTLPANKESGLRCNFQHANNLLKNGADLNGYSNFYENCTMGPVYFSAIYTGKKEIFNYVVKHGVDFNFPIRNDCPYVVSVFDNFKSFEFFDEIMTINPNLDYINNGKYLFSLAIKSTSGLSAEKAPEIDNEYFRYMKKILSYKNMNINYFSSSGDNILTYIFKNIDTFRYDRLLNTVQYLIKNGVSISHKNNEGYNALHYIKTNKQKFTDEEYEGLMELMQSK
ncbi:MAG: hypothetical protein PHE89_07445 [Alphaproteobacteria bacterium]|nr:hypothetical protein [Alphaproteobacteria bacterium]